MMCHKSSTSTEFKTFIIWLELQSLDHLLTVYYSSPSGAEGSWFIFLFPCLRVFCFHWHSIDEGRALSSLNMCSVAVKSGSSTMQESQ